MEITFMDRSFCIIHIILHNKFDAVDL